MKKPRWKHIRWIILALLLAGVCMFRFISGAGEFYACCIYPAVSGCLSRLASLVSFSLCEALVVATVVALLLYPIIARRRRQTWKSIVGRELEVLLWIYVWFYWGWGMNYFRDSFFERAEVTPCSYDEQRFKQFLAVYTDSLNSTYKKDLNVSQPDIEQKIKPVYAEVPDKYGLTRPESFQHPKQSFCNALYSGVGVLGYMGPFFAESQLNEELLPVQLPFTYAHELSHLLGVSNEAEANYWAYRVCRSSKRPAVRYSAYFGLLPYVLVNASSVLTEEEFREWIKTIRPEVVKDYEYKRMYWNERYSTLLGEVQNKIYNLFLKGNNIPSGRKNYAEVIGILLSLEEK